MKASHRSVVVPLALAVALGASGLLAVAAEKPSAGKGAATFEVYKDKSGAFRFRLKGDDGAILAMAGKGYQAKADCLKVLEAIRTEAGKAKINESDGKVATTETKAAVIEIYKDRGGAFRFRMHGAGGGVLAIASKGYKDKAACQKVVDAIKLHAARAKLEDESK
jgi:uncharacterized protein YegP (UPF0339 family)